MSHLYISAIYVDAEHCANAFVVQLTHTYSVVLFCIIQKLLSFVLMIVY